MEGVLRDFSLWRADFLRTAIEDWGCWSMFSNLLEEGFPNVRLRSPIDRFLHRESNPEYGWADVFFTPESASLRIVTDFSASVPVYSYRNGESIMVSNDLPDLLSVIRLLGFSMEIDRSAAYSFLLANFVPTDRTLVSGVRPFPASSVTFIDLSDSNKFRREPTENTVSVFHSEPEIPYPEAIDRYRAAFEKSMADLLEFSGLNSTGLLVTGGLDSSIIWNWFTQRTNSFVPITGVFAGFPDPDFENLAALEREFRTPVRKIILESRELRNLPKVLRKTWDITEAYGFWVSLNAVFEHCQDVSMFVAGYGTDSPTASTHMILSAIRSLVFFHGRTENLFDPLAPFPTDISTSKAGLEALEKKIADVPGKIQEVSEWMENILNFLKIPPLHPDVEFLPFSDHFGLSGHSPRWYDLFVALDMSGISHRMGLLYSKTSRTDSFAISPFSSRNVRNAVFSVPISRKLNPFEYPTTPRDNQFFYKHALSSFIPPAISKRRKMSWSLPNLRFWLFGEYGYKKMRKLFIFSMEQGYLPEKTALDLLSFYDALHSKRKEGFTENENIRRVVTLKLSLIWRCCLLGLYGQMFLGPHGENRFEESFFD